MQQFLSILLLPVLLSTAVIAADTRASSPPNIVLIYADDLGYGDVSCYGATRVATPNIDKLGREGLRFTDAHAPSATCTPSRYAMLTGEYAWRQQGTGILPGNAALIIKPGRTTLPAIMQKAGYATGVVGKWHLGLGDQNLDWNAQIKPGPLEIGFDYCYLIPATGDRVPCVYVENHHVVDLDPNDPIQVNFGKKIGDEPTGKEHPELLKMRPSHGHDSTIVNGISRIGFMTGGHGARWIDEDMADVITGKATSFIAEHRAKPFFLFFSLHDIHVPRVPHARFVGQTEMGPRGDAICQLDWCTGEIIKALEDHGLTENTLVILTSDNGPVVDDGYHDDAVRMLSGHRPAGPFRGSKYSAFEGGTRVPFIVRWPARVTPGESSALISQVDLPATFAALTGVDWNASTGPDSENVLPALLGESPAGRQSLVEHSAVLSVRDGSWKYIEPRKGPARFSNTNIESGFASEGQLFNLETDPGETNNLIKSEPVRARALMELLQSIKEK